MENSAGSLCPDEEDRNRASEHVDPEGAAGPNVRGAFSIAPRRTVEKLRLLLVDDIYTSGAPSTSAPGCCCMPAHGRFKCSRWPERCLDPRQDSIDRPQKHGITKLLSERTIP